MSFFLLAFHAFSTPLEFLKFSSINIFVSVPSSFFEFSQSMFPSLQLSCRIHNALLCVLSNGFHLQRIRLDDFLLRGFET
jgi:hypothetical protein